MDNKRGSRFIDRSGLLIGYITITGLSDDKYINPTTGKETYKWNYLCDCGNIGLATYGNLVRNMKFKQSCGCNAGGMRDTLLLHKEGLKKCGSCNEILELCEFGIRKKTLTGFASSCKKCKSITDRKYRENPAQGRESFLKKKSEYYTRVRTEDPERYDRWAKNNRENRDYSQEYKRMQSNEITRSKSAIRRLILSSLKIRNISKSKLVMRTEDILGCKFNFFKIHIESQFEEGMNWFNHGKWHIDHKVPLDIGETVDEIIKLNHYTNLQPLWADENLTKSSKILEEYNELYFSLLDRHHKDILNDK
jgi:hypothetical protein